MDTTASNCLVCDRLTTHGVLCSSLCAGAAAMEISANVARAHRAGRGVRNAPALHRNGMLTAAMMAWRYQAEDATPAPIA